MFPRAMSTPRAGTRFMAAKRESLRNLFEEIEHLAAVLTGPDQRARSYVFWYSSGKEHYEIESCTTIENDAKGVGSVIERLKH